MKNSKYTLGVDIGGTNVRCGAVSSDGKVVEVLKFKTWDYVVAENFVERLADDIVSLIRKYDIGDGKRVSVGIGAPNGNYYRSTIEFAPNLPFKGVFELGKMLTKSLSSRFMEADIVLTNDANAAAPSPAGRKVLYAPAWQGMRARARKSRSAASPRIETRR